MESFLQTFIRLTVIFLKFLFDPYTLPDALTFPAKRSYESDPLILVTSFYAHSLRTAERKRQPEKRLRSQATPPTAPC